VGSAGVFSVYFETKEPCYIARTFYDEEFSSSEATDISVAEGKTRSDINEELEEGGR